MIIGFTLPKNSRSTQQPIRFICRVALQTMHDSAQWRRGIGNFIRVVDIVISSLIGQSGQLKRLYQNVNMIRHDAPGKQFVERSVVMVQVITDDFSNLRLFKPTSIRIRVRFQGFIEFAKEQFVSGFFAAFGRQTKILRRLDSGRSSLRHFLKSSLGDGVEQPVGHKVCKSGHVPMRQSTATSYNSVGVHSNASVTMIRGLAGFSVPVSVPVAKAASLHALS